MPHVVFGVSVDSCSAVSKSFNKIFFCASKNRFDGLMSRWMIFLSRSSWSIVQSWSIILQALVSSRGVFNLLSSEVRKGKWRLLDSHEVNLMAQSSLEMNWASRRHCSSVLNSLVILALLSSWMFLYTVESAEDLRVIVFIQLAWKQKRLPSGSLN